ncbi:MAG TPA: thiolase family protein, partial [Candidatus Bathyarchaeia archaeon]|nr:thiolase family protein [Candidatus Bathyarchaeia archaeon]
SGLQALIGASQSIWCGDAQTVLAGGAESVTHMPQLIFSKEHDARKARGLNESLMNDGLMCSVTDRSMGVLCEGLAQQEKISRKEQDDYAFESYCRAVRAQEAGFFKEEILAVGLSGKEKMITDETIRKNIERSSFDRFSGAFEKKGTITAANSASPCDGAAMVLACSPDVVERFKVKPVARMVEHVSIAGDPAATFTLAGAAVEALLKKANRRIGEIDIFEISEAFAAQMIFTQRSLQVPFSKINPHGGDIALGHPLGAAGARGLVSLIHTLRREEKKRGVACACLGGGGAVAILVERC